MFIVGCSQCRRWFHGKCVRISQRESKRIPFWQCADCKELQNTEEGDEQGEIQLMFCVCRRPYDKERFYVGCDGCGDWYHPECVNTTEEKINALSGECYLCPDCEKRPQKWFDAKMMVTTKTESNG
uniref:PHD-type domain-containing protein n=1 Tax=Globodera rostochiensis TaxID=31243 RepID=A0A914H1P7_GLORO